ncbi:uncharacterized protein LOC117830199 [Xyrichtys novacula]|uniref:Uncharacterized protein LOC117830199 n=1 Tax=Xyrichtys novacula TaxID=13765 RepID=A0AAV1H4U9_XYRNO|nr:uncharacterized protein LOC117830199 [Xyrichtys novacula]
MNSGLMLDQFSHMRPPTFSEREQHCYRAEKMLLRQFVLLKLEDKVPDCLSIEDMKQRVLRGRSFIDESQEMAKRMQARELHLAEQAWSSARKFCVDQMEWEIVVDLKTEKRLSQLLGRKVTLEGLQMYLPIIRSKAEQEVRNCLLQLSSKLPDFFVCPDTGTRYKPGLVSELQRKTRPLAPQVVQTALDILLSKTHLHVEVTDPPSRANIKIKDSDLKLRIESSCTLIGRLLADAAASCFCLNSFFFRDRLQHFCTSESKNMVTAVYKRFTERSKSFFLLDFDESFHVARKTVLNITLDMMGDRLGAAYHWEQHQRSTEEEVETPEVHHVAEENTDERQVEERRGVRAFFRQDDP